MLAAFYFSMNLQSDDFTLFGLPQQFAQDERLVDARRKALQQEAHPDMFAAHGPAAQRLAMQWSVRINEAFQRLRDPLRRAAYLCELRGFPVQAERNTAMPAKFLVQQMEWREALDDAVSAEALETIDQQVVASRSTLLTEVAYALDIDNDAAAASHQVRSLMFIERFAADVHARIDQLAV